MTDMTLPQVPQAPAPVKAIKAAPKAVEDVPESESDQGFSKVLKTQMDTESKPAEGVDSAPDNSAKVAAPMEDVTEVAVDAGKPLPQTGKAGDALFAVLTANTAMTVAVTEEATEAAPGEPATTAVSTDAEVLPEDLELLNANVATGVRAETVVDAVHGQPARSAAITRPQLAPWSTGARTELPQSAQAAVAQAARELPPVDTEAAQTAPFALERFGVEVRALAGAQPRAAGIEALLTDRSLGAQSPQPAQATTQGMQNLLPQEATAGARPALPTATLDTPLRQPGWDQALGERVMWVVNNKFQGVELKLNPAHLGPIEVRVQMQNDQAQVSFVAQHAPVREALEAALPRLREMFGANGFNLVDVNVSQHSFAEQQRHAQTAEGNFRAGLVAEDEADLGSIAQQEFTRAGGQSRGVIDLFA